MFNFKGDIVRQLNNIYGLKFKPKFKNEIKNSMRQIIMNNIFRDVSFQNISSLEDYLVLEGFEIYKLHKPFFLEYKFILLEQLNPNWYEEKESKYKVPKYEQLHNQAVIMENIFVHIRREDSICNFFLYLEGQDYFFKNYFNDNNEISHFKTFLIDKYKKENKYLFQERKEDLLLVKEFLLKLEHKLLACLTHKFEQKQRALRLILKNSEDTFNKELLDSIINLCEQKQYSQINFDSICYIFFVELFNLELVTKMLAFIENKIQLS